MKVVFVHGALVFDGAWWWHRMVEPLATLGLGSRAVELPSCVAPPEASRGTVGDMYADADAVRAALDEEDGPVVLVGHSYGGMLITDAAAGHAAISIRGTWTRSHEPSTLKTWRRPSRRSWRAAPRGGRW